MASVQANEETYSLEETILIRKKTNLLDWGLFSGERFTGQIFYAVYKMAISDQNHMLKVSISFNLRPAGGCLNTPLRFFADSKKTAARSAAGFSPTLSPIFLSTCVKVSILGHARSGHQVRSSDHTLQKFTIAPQLQCLRESYETFEM